MVCGGPADRFGERVDQRGGSRLSHVRNRDQAKTLEAGAMAGATLIPTVTNAQKRAAKTESAWLREERVIFISLF